LIRVNPSRGGIGSILKTANTIFIIENCIKNFTKKELNPSTYKLLIEDPLILLNNNIKNIPPIASNIFVAGQARATINSHFLGSL